MPGVVGLMTSKIEQLFADQDALRRQLQRQTRQISTLERRVEDLLTGSYMTAPLTSSGDAVMLRVDEDQGGGRWRAKRLSWDGSVYATDTEDTADYFLETSPTGGDPLVGAVGWAVLMRVESGTPPKGIYQMLFTLPFLGVVTGCSRIDSIGNLILTAKRLQDLPYSFQAGEEITNIWAGADPMIVIDSMVVVFPIAPLPNDTTGIRYFAVPHLSIEPSTLDEPDANCITTFGTTCDPAGPADPCLAP